MIDVVLCEELRSFVGKITTVRLNGLLAGGGTLPIIRTKEALCTKSILLGNFKLPIQLIPIASCATIDCLSYLDHVHNKIYIKISRAYSRRSLV